MRSLSKHNDQKQKIYIFLTKNKLQHNKNIMLYLGKLQQSHKYLAGISGM